jgi:hypothetical protein
MPSVKLDLGRYVTLRRRADGTYRVLLEVPTRLRPSGWLPAIPLPVAAERGDGSFVPRRGDLTDEMEIRAIREDAAMLYGRLSEARLGRIPGPEAAGSPTGLAALSREWQGTQGFKDVKPRTQKGYAYHAGLIVDWWMLRCGGEDRAAAKLTEAQAEALLALYDDRPTTRRHLKIVGKMMFDKAVRLGWAPSNPFAPIKVRAPKTKLRIWEREDALAAAWVCLEEAQPGLAALILTEWEIGQRLTDARLFRWGAEYQPEEGAFRFWQEKTESYVTVHVSEALRAVLEWAHDPESLYLFVDAATGKPFAEQRLGHVWADIRKARGFDKRLVIRALRHACVVQLARAECTIAEIVSITGHSIASAHQILQKYLPRDNYLAWQAQQKRGLVGEDRRPAGHDARRAG